MTRPKLITAIGALCAGGIILAAATPALANKGALTTIVGTGVAGMGGDTGAAILAQVSGQRGLALLADGSMLVADTGNNRIRKVTPAGTIITVAGNGTAGSAGDGLLATSAMINAPRDVAVAADGVSFYIADTGGNRIRKVNAAGIISTIAGNGTAAFAGENVAGSAAQLTAYGLGIAPNGDLYVADAGNNRIRKLTATGGVLTGASTITTVAGGNTAGASGDSGPASAALLNGPNGVAVLSTGAIVIADTGNHTVRRIDSGVITTAAGTAGTACPAPASLCGDLGDATGALLNAPLAVAPDGAGGYLITDTGDNRIRQVAAAGTIATIAGTGTACAATTMRCGDGGPAAVAQLLAPKAAIAGAGRSIYISDGTHRIRLRTVDIGITGPIGPTGPGGATGATGASGAAGPAGGAGGVGPVGPVGADGPVGSSGPSGAKGAPGAAGAAGAAGETGDPGADGAEPPLTLLFARDRLKARQGTVVKIGVFASGESSPVITVIRGSRTIKTIGFRMPGLGRRTISLAGLKRGRYTLTLTAGSPTAADRATVTVR